MCIEYMSDILAISCAYIKQAIHFALLTALRTGNFEAAGMLLDEAVAQLEHSISSSSDFIKVKKPLNFIK